uniref:Nuclear protein MDM1 n=1 Tax=Lygus hesperus TaxID=30085 RepID=A0A0K8T3G9_LYGHE
MIGTFWNLCRACPSMPVDKLHSEYRSTYRWHEYTGPRQEVVRHPPQPVSGNKEEEENKYNTENSQVSVPLQGQTVEPALPRRKKHPSMAYRSNDFLSSRKEGLYHTSTSLDRARVITNFPIENCRPSKSSGLKDAISRISTEYRLQFAWPKSNKHAEDEGNSSVPRKSLSMGAIKPTSNIAPVHKKRPLHRQGSGGEMEPLVGSGDVIDLGGEEKIQEESFSKGEKHIFSESRSKKKEPDADTLPETWFSEVIELRKKAGQYKHRGWGTELVPEHIAELYSKQIGLWEQVSRRSSLSALSLASSTHRSITKEEKEKENNKKSSPTKAYWVQSDPKNEKLEDCKKDAVPHRSRMDYFIRHHLERTTGVGEEGILHSPTREKLEPVIPRRKDEASTSPQKTPCPGRSHSAGSPKKATTRAQHKTPPPEKRQRPTTLQTRSKPSTGSVKHKNKRPKEIFNNDSEKTKVEPEPEPVATEPVVKSPPEPTRVKSPEQILMRSPEPVNWTVPLDTGDLQWRAHSESKVRSEGSTRPTPSQSAPPALPGDVSRGIKGMSKEV